MHPQTRKNRSKKNLKKHLRELKDRITEMEGESLLLHTLMMVGDQFQKTGDNLVVRLKIPRGWSLLYRWKRLDGDDIVLEFIRERKEGDQE